MPAEEDSLFVCLEDSNGYRENGFLETLVAYVGIYTQVYTVSTLAQCSTSWMNNTSSER